LVAPLPLCRGNVPSPHVTVQLPLAIAAHARASFSPLEPLTDRYSPIRTEPHFVFEVFRPAPSSPSVPLPRVKPANSLPFPPFSLLASPPPSLTPPIAFPCRCHRLLRPERPSVASTASSESHIPHCCKMGHQCLPLAPGVASLPPYCRQRRCGRATAPAGATAASATHTRVENNLSRWAGQGQARPRGPRSAGLGQSTDSDFSFDYRIL
jgi:hypothetical protein